MVEAAVLNLLKMDRQKIVIIGAGPAGTTTAIKLAQQGFSVLLVDKDTFPRDKVCGDAVSGDGLAIAESFGLLKELQADGCTCTKRELYLSQTPPQIITKKTIDIPREKFDHILFKKALALGVNLIQAEFTGQISNKKNYYSIELLDQEQKSFFVDCDYVVAATGCQNDRALKALGKKHKIARPDQVACRGYYQAKWPIKERKYFFLPELSPGYAWIFPLGDNLFNVGCGGKILKSRKLDLKGCLASFVSKTDKEYNCFGKWAKQPQGAVLRSSFSNFINFKEFPNLILIGEALGTTYPFSGGGIGKAMLSGVLAAEAIIETIERPEDGCLSKIYQRKIKQKMLPKYHLFFRLGDYLLTKSWLRNFVYKRVFANEQCPDLIPKLICGLIKPEQVFSLPFMFKLGLKRKISKRG